jgi:hypothetical protein
MNLKEIEERVADVRAAEGSEFLFELLRAYGIPKASITRLRSGSYNRSEQEGEYLWRGKVYYRSLNCPDEELYAAVDAAKADEQIVRERPRFAVARNENRLVAADLKTGDALDIEIGELQNHAAFFLPWAGIEKTQIENLNLADVKAAEKMAKLYDEITNNEANAVETEEQIHELNVFFSRLLFCFFTEDTGVFEKGSFTNAIGSLSLGGGEDLHELLDQIFDVLNTEPESRIGFPSHLRKFGYVNGKLFERHSSAPRFTARARSIVLECGTLDWSQINPDIFGSMIQAVVHPGQRGKLGMHYTSTENIMKVIRPLFLDDLEEEFDAAKDSTARLDRLLDRLAAIQVFDPACGSGNFLVIAYKELRRLEHRILEQIAELDRSRRGLFALSRIPLDNFYGIEVDDFAHEIATLSLWLAKHQMNVEFEELFGVEIPLIPLTEAGNISCGNATRMDWRELLSDPAAGPTYVLGNPPYAGSSMQDQAQKEDFEAFFGTSRYPRNLDYIALWFFKGAEYIAAEPNAEAAFVSTNSVSQGDHVGLMWPRVLESGVKISFAYEPFLWSNQARGRAGVTCVIIGLTMKTIGDRYLYSTNGRHRVANINPYLRSSDSDTIVHASRKRLNGLPAMVFGSKATDGGYLNFTPSERDHLIEAEPRAERFLRRYVGSRELINGDERYCLWIGDDEAEEAMALPGIRKLTDQIAAFRARGSIPAKAMADRPYRFLQRAHRDGTAIAVPRVSSERRRWIPIGFVDGRTVLSDQTNAIYGAEPWLFGLIQSCMHMVWLDVVGGRMKSDYRYSAILVYNTFPVPKLSASDKDALKVGAIGVLAAREQFSDRTLAELYDPGEMPGGLLDAHKRLDETVDRLYRPRPFESDEERLKVLFAMYKEMVEAKETVDA